MNKMAFTVLRCPLYVNLASMSLIEVALTPESRPIKNGRSPGLVVMGRDSRSKGRGFESRHRILDGHFSHIFVVKIVMFVWKDRK